MSVTEKTRAAPGAAAVARIDTLPEIEAWWVGTLRAFCDGTHGPIAAGQRLSHRLGVQRGQSALGRLSDLMGLVAEFSRRPLLRHAPDCPCVGADEAVFALFCATAGAGEREDATMIACTILRPDVAPMAVSLAEGLGLELAAPSGMPAPHATVH